MPIKTLETKTTSELSPPPRFSTNLFKDQSSYL